MGLKFTKINEVYFLVEGITSSDIIDIQELYLNFQYMHPNAKFMPAYKNGSWDGEVRFINYLDSNRDKALAPVGLLRPIMEFCSSRQIELIFENGDIGIRELKHFDKIDIYFDKVLNPSLPGKMELRDYQRKAIKQALKIQKATLISPTGSGKSLILYGYIRWILDHEFEENDRLLLVVPNTTLVEQMAKDFIGYGYKRVNNIEKIYHGQEKNFSSQIIISTWQSLYKYEYEFFEQFRGIIIDECHGAKANKLRYVSENCINAEFRLGTTGTLQSDLLERYQVTSHLGTPFRTKTTVELVSEGHLSEFLVKNTVLKWKTKEKLELSTFDEEYSAVLKCPERRDLIVNFIQNVYNNEPVGTFLVLGNRIDYLKDMYAKLKEKYDNVYLIYGEIKEKDRQVILEKIKKCGGILVANLSILGTGINIPNVFQIVVATPFKSADILAIQMIGRAIRLYSGKKMATIYDFFDKIPIKGKQHNNIFKWLQVKEDVYRREGYKHNTYQIEMQVA